MIGELVPKQEMNQVFFRIFLPPLKLRFSDVIPQFFNIGLEARVLFAFP